MNKESTLFKDLHSFLNVPRIKFHTVQKGVSDYPISSFISVDGFVSSNTIIKLIGCLIEKGRKAYLTSSKNIDGIDKEIENWIEAEYQGLVELLAGIDTKIKKGQNYKVSPLSFDDEDSKYDKSLSKLDLVENPNYLKNLILDEFKNCLQKDEIKNELLAIYKLKNKIGSETPIKCFIEFPNPKLLISLHEFLQNENLIQSDLVDFSNLFSGRIPQRKVVFKCANTLNKIKKLMVSNGLRSKKSYSLATQFGPYVEFFDEKGRDKIIKSLITVSTNNIRYSNSTLAEKFKDFCKSRQ
jgi:hypothetical protein